MKPLASQSYQEHMLRKISLHDTTPDFPKLEDFGIGKSEMEDYLSEKQDVLDLAGSQTHQLTILAGIVLVCCFVFSYFDHMDTFMGTNASLVGMLVGVVLALAWWLCKHVSLRGKLRKLYNENIERYLAAVENY